MILLRKLDALPRDNCLGCQCYRKADHAPHIARKRRTQMPQPARSPSSVDNDDVSVDVSVPALLSLPSNGVKPYYQGKGSPSPGQSNQTYRMNDMDFLPSYHKCKDDLMTQSATQFGSRGVSATGDGYSLALTSLKKVPAKAVPQSIAYGQLRAVSKAATNNTVDPPHPRNTYNPMWASPDLLVVGAGSYHGQEEDEPCAVPSALALTSATVTAAVARSAVADGMQQPQPRPQSAPDHATASPYRSVPSRLGHASPSRGPPISNAAPIWPWNIRRSQSSLTSTAGPTERLLASSAGDSFADGPRPSDQSVSWMPAAACAHPLNTASPPMATGGDGVSQNTQPWLQQQLVRGKSNVSEASKGQQSPRVPWLQQQAQHDCSPPTLEFAREGRRSGPEERDLPTTPTKH